MTTAGETGDPVAVCAASDIAPGATRSFRVGDWQVLVCNVGGDLYAVEDVCTHDRAPLGEGRLRGPVVECPRHGARFDVRDGSVKAPPAIRPLPCLPVRVVEDRVEVRILGEPSSRRRRAG